MDVGPLANHRRGCRPTKRRLNTALGKAKEIIGLRKRRRLENHQPQCSGRAITEALSSMPTGTHPRNAEGENTASHMRLSQTCIDEEVVTVSKTHLKFIITFVETPIP